MPQVNEMTADDWTVILPQAYDIYSKGCNNEMARTFGSLNDETMINTLTRSSPFFESELHRAAGRMAKCIIVDLDRCEESNAVLRYYLPWLGNELDLCSERKNVGFSKKNRTHIQKGSAEAILKLNEFDEAMFQFGTQLFEYQLRNTNGPNHEGAASTTLECTHLQSFFVFGSIITYVTFNFTKIQCYEIILNLYGCISELIMF